MNISAFDIINMPNFHVMQPYFDYIKNGDKKWEGRPEGSRMVETTKTGDIVEIWTGPNGKDRGTMTDSCLILIGQRLVFPNIEEMLETCGVGNMLPELASDPKAMKKGIKIYKDLRLKSGKSENGQMIAIELKK
jgi:ASC-1-like (ASCH) protein